MAGSSDSFYRKFRRNKGALGGVTLISLAVFTALFAYVLAPDNSPQANRMMLELATVKPGHQQLVLVLHEQEEISTGWWEGLINGWPDKKKYIPIHSYQIRNDTLFAEKIIDEKLSTPVQFPANQTSIKTIRFWLGSDRFGRDILSRLIVGTRVSLGVGITAVIVSVFIGLILGAVAGYYRGRIDAIISWLIQVVWSLPSVLLVFSISLALGKGLWVVYTAVGLSLWVHVARLVRGQVLSIREMNYIEAAQATGISSFSILYRHILPNLAGPLIVIAAGNFATAILLEAGLSFLGIGVQAPQPSWGLMVREHYNFLITQKPLLALIPGMAIMILVLAFNLTGNGLRDAFDVRDRK